MTLQPSARLGEARKALAASYGLREPETHSELLADRAKLRAALEQAVAYAEDLIAIVNEAAEPGGAP